MTIVYAGTSLLTSDAVATGVLEYAARLARAGTADTLVVPGVRFDGSPTKLEVLVGPASQMIAEPSPASYAIDDAGFLDELARRMRPVEGGAVAETPGLPFLEDY